MRGALLRLPHADHSGTVYGAAHQLNHLMGGSFDPLLRQLAPISLARSAVVVMAAQVFKAIGGGLLSAPTIAADVRRFAHVINTGQSSRYTHRSVLPLAGAQPGLRRWHTMLGITRLP